MISKLIALPYEVARLPLVVAEKNLLAPLPEASAPRVVLDRTIGSADRLAGTLLGNPAIAQRGNDRIEQTDKLVTAARLEKKATLRRDKASAVVGAGREEATEKRQAARERVASAVDDADTVEARGKQQATAKAAKAEAAKERAADRRSEARTESAERRKKNAESAAESKQRSAQSKASSQAQESLETKSEAAAERADAERLSDLTEAKKRQRTQR